MPFFFPQQQAGLAREQQETDIFQLLSLLESSSPQCGPRRQHKPVQTFTPRFDILETGSAYELYGELPGLDQQSLDIQFEDAQTLVLKGRTQRPSTTSSVAVEKAVEEAAKEPEKENHNATVEDEYDSVDTPLTAATATASPSTTVNEEKRPEQTEAPKPKYWLSERRVGNFARSFSFSQRIEIDDVQAELKEGILHVVVPKSVKSRKVAVNLHN